ncbi:MULTISPECIES: acetate--CoA ligase family protein [unclassified Cupriavidus]|uniref:acetate--CoA ligase family protein n=1 Tax=unclassified Cupriavidus TaxID=2640874 RepID=UPI001C006CC8|nr:MULTISPECIES: acetate--CoA ligase family protein [unclassified Cupriavidus]MCA3188539.1 acetate--CoA ligase family protein [Cupriavidus sp.]MCA3199529.1 acetate--CoA ligase family protein [Cupriavidus sp.]MCA3204452.1 acetate--CoA ligase family protein [Cupriavidus sp.]MCA3210445.1 acetate--CoA ligase family protein [Cupriavidus sp.]QWE97460.1 acetate--CoA ligase family protein [Cupriavidus sp. EM10]
MLDLQPLLCPRSIAVVGASTQPEKVGGVPLRLLAELGYGGRVFPVNPGAETVQGLRAYASVADIGEPVDLAIVAVPAPAAPDVMAQLGQAGTRAAVVFTSGFAEVSGGDALQNALATQARAHGVQLLGPNCLGAMNLGERMFATFSPIPLSGVPPVGQVGLVSQSGAFGAYAFALAREAGLGLSHWVTTGNEAGLQVADVIEWLANDPQTRVILAYIEGARDGMRLRRALAAARAAGKPVVIAKVGTTAAGASAAQSHTASLAGEDAVYQAVFDEYGVHRAHTIETFFRLGYTLARGRRPAQWQSASGMAADAVAPAAIVTVSGGVGIMMADSAETLGLPLPPMPDAAAQALRTAIPFASTANPIDVTGQVVAQPQVFVDALANVARCGQYGAVAAFLAGGVNAPRLWPLFQDTVTALESDAAAAPLLISGVMDADKREWLEARGCLVFREPAQTMEAVAALARAAAMEATAQADDTAPALPTLPQPVPADANALSEAEAMALLADAGVPVVPHGVAQDAEAAVEIAGSIGYPVAVKICSRHILHKSDIGGVVLNLRDADAVRAAFEQVRQAASQAHDADGNAVPFEGAIVAGMARGWGEIMVGVRRDPVFGLVALAGIGGTAVEIFRQMAFGLAPLSRQRARAMLTQSRAAALCSGHRGHPAIDLDRVADVLVNVSRAAAAIGDRLDTLEINPFIVGSDGLVAADAVITLR